MPLLARALGLELGVDRDQERLNQSSPGWPDWLVVRVLSGTGAPAASRGRWGAAIVFLAGLHVTSVHAPVMRKVFEGDLPAGDALFHTSGGPPLLVLDMWMLATEMRPQHHQRRTRTQKNRSGR